MQRSGKNIIISFSITLVAAIIAIIIVVIKRNEKTKGEKLLWTDIISNERYNIEFETQKEYRDGKPYLSVYLDITNNLDENQKFTFKGVYFKLKNGKEVSCGKLNDNGFTINPHEDDYYFFGCPTTTSWPKLLHFSLNGDYYNITLPSTLTAE